MWQAPIVMNNYGILPFHPCLTTCRWNGVIMVCCLFTEGRWKWVTRLSALSDGSGFPELPGNLLPAIIIPLRWRLMRWQNKDLLTCALVTSTRISAAGKCREGLYESRSILNLLFQREQTMISLLRQPMSSLMSPPSSEWENATGRIRNLHTPIFPRFRSSGYVPGINCVV